MPQDFAPDWKRYCICGDAKRMAPDIDRALHCIVAKPGGMNEARARTDIQELTETGRYRKDVY
jgi:sulfite reductase (NADPH) flavoprotein alpha-component